MKIIMTTILGLILTTSFSSFASSESGSPYRKRCGKVTGKYVKIIFDAVSNKSTTPKELLSLLKTYPVSHDAVNQYCETLAMASIEKNRKDLFEVIVSHFKIKNFDKPNPKNKETIYSYSLRFGNWSLFQTIKQRGGKGQLYGTMWGNYIENSTPLPIETQLLLASTGRSLDIVKRLLKEGLGVNTKYNSGSRFLSPTPLSFAAVYGAAEIFKYMIDIGGSIHSSHSESFDVPLSHLPISEEKLEILIDYGVNVNKSARLERTILHQYMSTSSNEIILQKIIDSGADINAQDENGMTPLMIAAHNLKCRNINTMKKFMEILIKNGADKNLTFDNDHYGKSINMECDQNFYNLKKWENHAGYAILYGNTDARLKDISIYENNALGIAKTSPNVTEEIIELLQ